MSANQPPSSPPPPQPGRGNGVLLALIGVLAVGGIIGGVVYVRSKDQSISTPVPETVTKAEPAAAVPEAAPPAHEPAYGSLNEAPSGESAELWWIDVGDPKGVHHVLRKNAWLGKALNDPLGRGFLAAWGGFFGTRGEDLGGAFKGAMADLVLDRVLASPYRVAWFDDSTTNGAPAVTIPSPQGATVDAFDTLIKVAAAGGFDPPSCVESKDVADGGAVAASVHRVVVADKTLFIAKLPDRIVLSPRPHAAMIAMCKPLPAAKTAAASLGFSPESAGRGAQSLGELVGLEGALSFDFKIENETFAPVGLGATAASSGVRLAAAAPSQALLKAIPERSGVVLFLAVKLPKDLTAVALRDTLAPADENFKGTKKEWPLEPRQVAVVWNPRGLATNEIAVLWDKADDEKGIDDALAKGNPLVKGKACSVLVYASTKELLADTQSACGGSKPSLLQAAPAIVKGLGESTSIAVTVNLGHVFSQLTLDGWTSEHAAPNQRTGPQEIEAARKLLEELPTVGFRATVAADGSITAGGFRS